VQVNVGKELTAKDQPTRDRPVTTSAQSRSTNFLRLHRSQQLVTGVRKPLIRLEAREA
jgi:hypothetical protein